MDIQCDRNLFEPVTRHSGVFLFRRKRAKTELIERAIGAFSATVPGRDENREPMRSKRFSHSRLSPRDIIQKFGICPPGSELALPPLAFVVDVPPAVLIQFEQRGSGADGLRQLFGASLLQPSGNHAEIYRRIPFPEKPQQPPQRRFIFVNIVIAKEDRSGAACSWRGASADSSCASE